MKLLLLPKEVLLINKFVMCAVLYVARVNQVVKEEDNDKKCQNVKH